MNQSEYEALKRIQSEVNSLLNKHERPRYSIEYPPPPEFTPEQIKRKRDYIQYYIDNDYTLEAIEMSMNTQRLLYDADWEVMVVSRNDNWSPNKAYRIKLNYTIPFGTYLLIGPRTNGEAMKKYYKDSFNERNGFTKT